MIWKVLLAITSICALLALYAVLNVDRWNTPAYELETALRYCKALEALENRYLEDHHKYGSLQDLLGSASTERNHIKHECEGGYCFAISVDENRYAIHVVPDRRDNQPAGRHLSLFADQTGTIRVAYGLPGASLASSVLSETYSRVRP